MARMHAKLARTGFVLVFLLGTLVAITPGALADEIEDELDTKTCARPYSPGYGPIPYGPLTPFGVCGGTFYHGCTVYVKHYGHTCIKS